MDRDLLLFWGIVGGLLLLAAVAGMTLLVRLMWLSLGPGATIAWLVVMGLALAVEWDLRRAARREHNGHC